jgi:hypothetical protein
VPTGKQAGKGRATDELDWTVKRRILARESNAGLQQAD